MLSCSSCYDGVVVYILLLFCCFFQLQDLHCCRTRLGPNEVDVKDLSSLPNASKKDSAAPAIQKYAEPPKGKNKVRKQQEKKAY